MPLVTFLLAQIATDGEKKEIFSTIHFLNRNLFPTLFFLTDNFHGTLPLNHHRQVDIISNEFPSLPRTPARCAKNQICFFLEHKQWGVIGANNPSSFRVLAFVLFCFFLFNFLSSPFYSALFKDSLCIHAREKKTRVVIFQAPYSREVGGSKMTLMTVSIKNDHFWSYPAISE